MACYSPRMAALLLLVLLAIGCIATPLPQPPIEYALDVHAVEVRGGNPNMTTTVVTIVGKPGAIRPGGIRIRFTKLPTPNQDILPSLDLVNVAEDGSFAVSAVAGATSTFLIEAVEADQDVYVDAISFTILPDGRSSGVVRGEPGPDSDGDESPDAVDCAPDDPAIQGSRCN